MTLIEEQPGLEESPLDLTLGLALLRSERMELVVQKGTELGLKALVPVRSARCTVRLDPDRVAQRLERWRRIAKQAVKQCRRRVPLEIRPVAEMNEILAAAGTADLKIMLHEGLRGLKRHDLRSVMTRGTAPQTVWVLVGPEGGFTEAETASALQAGFEVIGMGPRTLRSETAALAIIAILGFELGDLINFS